MNQVFTQTVAFRPLLYSAMVFKNHYIEQNKYYFVYFLSQDTKVIYFFNFMITSFSLCMCGANFHNIKQNHHLHSSKHVLYFSIGGDLNLTHLLVET